MTKKKEKDHSDDYDYDDVTVLYIWFFSTHYEQSCAIIRLSRDLLNTGLLQTVEMKHWKHAFSKDWCGFADKYQAPMDDCMPLTVIVKVILNATIKPLKTNFE